MKIDANRLRALLKSHGLTNTSLAAKAGITRQALHAMLKEKDAVEVRDRTVKGLVQALRLGDGSVLSPDPLMGYKQAVAEENAYLTFRGLGLPTTEPRSMDDIYVPIRAVRVPSQRRGRDCQTTTEAEQRPIEEPDKLTVPDCLARHRRILLCGWPGSGKTTELRHAARTYARSLVTKNGRPSEARVPLMVCLPDFARACERDNEMTLIRFVVTHALPDATPEFWAEVERNIGLELKQGNCLVLLDGLDEVGGNNLSSILRSFVRDFGKNTFVLTSRIVGLDAGPWKQLDFVQFRVARWGEEDIREFTRLWFDGRSADGKKLKKGRDERAEELSSAILNNPSLRQLASNPLMLTILAQLHYANATLPRRRVDLYSKIVQVMLESWEASKRGAGPGDPLHGIVLDGREFGWFLERLALAMQREGRVLRPRWWVNDCAQTFLREQMALDEHRVKEQSECVIRYLCERTSLLVERGDGIFGFQHRTFQEYFAARGLLLEAEGGDDIIALLRPFLFHPQWEEVVVNVAALLSAPRATTLLRIILDDPDPAGRFLRRGQRLALRCLVEGTAVADRALLDQIFQDGDAIGKSRWLGVSIGLIKLLRRLVVTRYEDDAQRMTGEIEQSAKRELLDSDYLTFHLSSHDPPDGPKDSPPGTVYRKRVGGRQLDLVWLASERRIKDPDSWFTDALKAVRDAKTEVMGRIALISLLGEEANFNDKAGRALKELLVRDRLPTVRAECAEALGQVASSDSAIAKVLLERLDKDKSDVVRARCAAALYDVAPNNVQVRTRLEELFASGPESVRVGAAKGLWGLDFTSPDQESLRERFLTAIASPAEPTWVRCASIWTISSLIGQDGMAAVDRVIEDCLDDHDPIVSRVAHHALAEAIAQERKAWSRSLVGRIETGLMGVSDPCCHLFGDLAKIVGMKEVHGACRLERQLGDALDSLADWIKIAFVFGSVARLEQVRDSDIDLMIVGDVRLKDIAAVLHSAEQILGRTVNPVLFSAEKFREQYREGNPLLLDVVRKEKIFLKGSRDELTKLVADGAPG